MVVGKDIDVLGVKEDGVCAPGVAVSELGDSGVETFCRSMIWSQDASNTVNVVSAHPLLAGST